MSDAVRYEQQGHIVTLTLNRPDSRNALDEDVVEALVAACDRMNRDLTVRCAILTAAGKAFCAGGNVKDMHTGKGLFDGNSAKARRNYRYGIQRIPMAFHELEVPVIAAVNGPAIGAGCDLAMMCDIRIAAEEAVFAESFVKLGLISGDGGSWYLPRAVGTSRAYEMTLTGDQVKGERAVQWGLVSALYPADRLMAEARAIADKIAANPPHSVRLNKRLMRESEGMTLAQTLQLAASLQGIVQHTDDFHEAVAAFIEKRKPTFKAG